MQILVLNCGSSSIKYQLFELPAGEVRAKGLVERIGEPEGKITQQAGDNSVSFAEPFADHAVGLRRAIELLTKGDHAPLSDIGDIGAVGHRVVHGGERFTETARIDDAVIDAIEDHVELAPLHNPPNLLGIRVARELLPAVCQVAVFDTSFHQRMPAHAYTYALPLELYREARVRRYGFHGTSHRYVAQRAAALLGRPLAELKLITCHLGNGASMAAVDGGRSIDTSMGLTPLEGLVMGTRCGDLDPAIVFHLARTRGLDLDGVDKLLNKKSGLLGVSGQSNDMRELLRLRADGDERAGLAFDIYCYRIKKYLGAYTAVLGRVDAVVFTAGVGENSADVRAEACAGLEQLGIILDADKNRSARSAEIDVSAALASTRVLVVPTNEEKMIAMETHAIAVG